MNKKYIHSGGDTMIDKRAEIFASGRELFYAKGFKDTNVADIAKGAGIGVGTFYNYFSSKEELFLEVYIQENEALKKRMLETIDLKDDPVTLVTKMVTHNIQAMNSNRILKEWFSKDLFSKLEKYSYKTGGLESIDELMHSGLADLIKLWKAEGKIRGDIEDDMIAAIMNSVLYIDMHKSDIGIQFFPEIMHYITEFIMKGLTEGAS